MKNYWLASIILLAALNSAAQKLNDKVQFVGSDGKTYSGIITSVSNDQFYVKYDGYDFSAWLTASQFQVVNQQGGPIKTAGTTKWKVGDPVEVQDIYNNNVWENATITVVHEDWNPVRYKAALDNPAGHAITELLLTPQEIRARGLKAATFRINESVDVYYADGTPHGRGNILEAKPNNRYKVRYKGCSSNWDEEVDWSQLQPEKFLSPKDPDVAAVFGKWAMFVYSYPNTYTDGNNVYRVYGTGAKAPPLQINADGTYTWYDEYAKPPVKGKWITHAMMDPKMTGTEAYNGIILYDSKGVLWKIHKDRANHIEARKMCSGETQGGTKL